MNHYINFNDIMRWTFLTKYIIFKKCTKISELRKSQKYEIAKYECKKKF